MARRIVLSEDEEEGKEIVVKRLKRSRVLESGDEEEAALSPQKSKSTQAEGPRKKEKESSWQEKLNLKPDDYLLDPKDRTPEPLSDSERPAAILRDLASTSSRNLKEPKNSRREKNDEAQEFERRRQKKLEAIRRQTLENKKSGGEQRKRVRLESSSSSSSDDGILPKNTLKDFELTVHYRATGRQQKTPRRQDLRDDTRPNAVGISTLRQQMEERRTKQKGQFKPKESLLEEIHAPVRHPERSPAGPSHMLPLFPDRPKPPQECTFLEMPSELPQIEPLSDSSRETHDHKGPGPLEEAPELRNNEKLEESEEEEEITRKRVRPVHISDDEDEDEATVAGSESRKEEKPRVQGVEAMPMAREQKPPAAVVEEASMTPAAAAGDAKEVEQLDIKPDITKFGPFVFRLNHNEEADADIQPCLQKLEDGDLIIAEEEEEIVEETKNHEDAQERLQRREKDRKLKLTMDKMMLRFQTECFSQKYDSINRHLQPIYVIQLAYSKTKGLDMAMTVFDNGRGQKPRYVCEMVPAEVVLRKNPQLLIDCEERHHEASSKAQEVVKNRPGPSTLV